VENSSKYSYHILDPTTPWYDWLCYCEICHQLKVQDQPNVTRYLRYKKFLKELDIN
jgi:hypothetical protein